MNAEGRAYQLTLQKYDLFKSQNPEIGRFDITFEIEGKLLFAHKNMLNLVSDTFESMLSERWMTKDEAIKIADYSYNNFYQFLTFLYCGECELTDRNIYTLTDIAEFYGVTLFKAYCDAYLAAMTITTENIFSLLELADKYSMDQLKASLLRFIIANFQSFTDSDAFLKSSKSVIDEIFTSVKDNVKPEDLFIAIYNWSEKCALVEQAANPYLNLNNAIKFEISNFLPNIRFCEMDLDFLHEFVVPRGFIFSSLNELSKILCSCKLRRKVKVTNSLGQTLHGNILQDKNVIKNIKSLKFSTCFRGCDKCCWWSKEFIRPSTPSPLKKRNGIEWYLIYYPSGTIGVEHYSFYNENHYLLAELNIGITGFDGADGCKIEIK